MAVMTIHPRTRAEVRMLCAYNDALMAFALMIRDNNTARERQNIVSGIVQDNKGFNAVQLNVTRITDAIARDLEYTAQNRNGMQVYTCSEVNPLMLNRIRPIIAKHWAQIVAACKASNWSYTIETPDAPTANASANYAEWLNAQSKTEVE